MLTHHETDSNRCNWSVNHAVLHLPYWRRRQRAALILTAIAVLAPAHISGEPVSVRHTEGIVHGFLALRTMDGALLANGDLIQTARGE